MGIADQTTTRGQILFGALFYSLCSSSMLIVNKFAVRLFPMPSTVATIQLAFCAVVVLVIKYGKLAVVDDIVMSKAKPYMVYTVLFSLSIYSNIQALNTASVETVIIFRSMSPFFVCFMEFFFLGRQFPSTRSIFALVLIIIGAACFVGTDKAFASEGYSAYTWASLYLFLLCLQMTYGKKIMKSVDMASLWGPVLYANSLGVLPSLFVGFASGEYSGDTTTAVLPLMSNTKALVALLASCVLGVAISWAGFNCRNLLSATQYTLLGVMNKILTIVANVMLFDDHANLYGIAALGVAIAGGIIYKQAPLASESI
jgi:GDP-mannose transporter